MSETLRDLLLLTPDFPPEHGGIQCYVSELANHFANRITVIAPQISVTTFDHTYSFPIIRQSLLFKNLWPKWIKTVLILFKRKHSYRLIIISHLLPFGTAAWLACKITKKPFVIITHGMDVRLAMKNVWKHFLAKHILRDAYLVVSNSNALGAELVNTFQLANVLVVYPCVKINELTEYRSPNHSDSFRLITVSRLIDRKGHERVLNALAILKLNGSLLNFHYDIVGSGPMQSNLEAMVQELNLSNHVQFHGEVDESILKNLYASSDIFVMPVKNDPTDKEGFGLVYLEAALFGIPSIATNMSGVNEAVIDQSTGLLVADSDIKGLADSILLLATDITYRKQLGEMAKNRAQTEFSCEAQFSKLDPYFV